MPIEPDGAVELSRPLRWLSELVAGGARVALAVSGGADSMALMHVVARTIEPRLLRNVLVLTVDHGLRPGSADEARQVASWSQALGFSHLILTWEGEKPRSSVEVSAREARYALLTEAALAKGARAIVTAHTADDQAETVLMRLARGSGVDGLSGMASASIVQGVLLLRPWLDVSHSDLVSFLSAEKLPWLEDPSNDDPAFERARIRQHGDTLRALGLAPAPLGLTAQRLARARLALVAETDRHALRIGQADASGAITYDRKEWQALPEELRIRLLARAIASVTGDPDPVNLASLETVAYDLATGAGGRSLHGALILAQSKNLFVVRELGRMEKPVLQLRPGQEAIWDRRYKMSLMPNASAPMVVRLPTPAELGQLTDAGGPALHARARAVTPVVATAAGDLIAAPLLGLSSPLVHCDVLARWLEPTIGPMGLVAGDAGNA